MLEHREGRINPLHLVMALLALASSIWIGTHADSEAWTTFAGLLLVGTALYFIARRSIERTPETP